MATKPPTTSKPPAGKPTGKPTSKPVMKPGVHSKPSSDKPGASRPAKSFSVKPLSGEGEGEKIGVFGKSGLGKTTLAAQLDKAVFIPLDDGARKIANPITGKPVMAVTDVVDWADLRDAVQQAPKYVPEGGVLVIDTLTRAQPLAEAWVVANVSLEKGGRAKNIEQFGYGKGYRHVLDQIRLLLTDLDTVIRSGRSVVLLMQLDQAIVPNAEGTDYYEEVPKLIENKQGPVRTEVCEWLDHVFRMGYLDKQVEKDSASARVGKVSGESQRAVYTGGAQHFTAKTRPIDGNRLPEIISFDDIDDNSLWQFVFEGATLADAEGGA